VSLSSILRYPTSWLSFSTHRFEKKNQHSAQLKAGNDEQSSVRHELIKPLEHQPELPRNQPQAQQAPKVDNLGIAFDVHRSRRPAHRSPHAHPIASRSAPFPTDTRDNAAFEHHSEKNLPANSLEARVKAAVSSPPLLFMYPEVNSKTKPTAWSTTTLFHIVCLALYTTPLRGGFKRFPRHVCIGTLKRPCGSCYPKKLGRRTLKQQTSSSSLTPCNDPFVQIY
jgi:hypothetical protein